VVEKGTSFNDPSKLTFEQAAQMGVAPADAPKAKSAEKVPPAPVKPEPVVASDEDLAGFDDLFKNAGKKPGDATSFWDAVVEKGTSFNDPDKLTFEQASRMGLTPDADKNKKK
jgi:hypothetical protein